MTLTELLPSIQSLPRSEKVRLIRLLAADVAGEQALEAEQPAREDSSKGDDTTQYPLRGTSVHYEQPTEPVAESAWEALK
ncbi:MAG: hypothetical protein HQ567_05390 [Candidatus Nealsonbacteria bacterium]|nr:hypothetical protein [Candidatus Nealsonbacteria bacterium]